MQKATQLNNTISISTPLGEDVLYLTRFSAQEAISQLFSISASMYTIGTRISLDDLIGQPVSIKLKGGEGLLFSLSDRYFHGVVSYVECSGARTAAAGDDEDYLDYYLTIQPTAAFMKKRSNCRIYQNKSVIEIVTDLFGQHNVEFKDLTTSSYPKYDYCVQYQESDLDFVSRLLQLEGIFYYFEHTDASHTLLLVDSATAYEKCEQSLVECNSGSLSVPHVASWQGGLSMVNGAFLQKGYDFKQPKKFPSGDNAKASMPSQEKYEIYDYIGESEYNKRAKPAADIRLEALQKDMLKSSGQSDCRSFGVGKTFTFTKHEDSRYIGQSFLITGMRTEATQSNQTGASQFGGDVYRNSFECVPSDTPYRPTALRNKPLINGVQTAVVTGDAGDEILVDKYGRVKVQFHWDREGQNDSKSSCWIRVAQNWAGNKWGAFFFPRVGQEVLVDFINGDPDQPIISGAIYNADLMPPYTLPDKKTQSGIKSHSTKQGAASNFNELRFEDEKGKELLFFQAEKDHELNVKNNQTDTVGNNRITQVNNDDTSTIANNQTIDVGKTLNITAGTEIVLTAGGASITMSSSGAIDIKGTNITVNGTAISLKAAAISLN
ncbi:type VI secretion system tip protein VgrG [Psychromonas sp. SP041]|uniref:type VI secretion system Vgr family protein n=1 Tax=Psychromonas sp. SP041 TaxID=1365007 RepID=UPI0010C7809F|nr:type VI secretion system tip protein VgrG [Psychromonas sp. SP041]